MPKLNFIQRFRERQIQKQFQRKLDDFGAANGIKPGLSALQLKQALALKIKDESARNKALMKLGFIKK
ncbi:MAG: hypothetical protein WC915_06330 [archaeon]|jgi:hypothetical protein